MDSLASQKASQKQSSGYGIKFSDKLRAETTCCVAIFPTEPYNALSILSEYLPNDYGYCLKRYSNLYLCCWLGDYDIFSTGNL